MCYIGRVMKNPATTSIRFNDADQALLQLLKKRTGITSSAELVRLGLRALAAKEGVSPTARKTPSPTTSE